MAFSLAAILSAIIFFLPPLLLWVCRVLYSVWWKPKRLEKLLKDQGIVGLPYKLLYGNLKENAALNREAHSKPMGFSHNIIPRVSPLVHRTVEKYGNMSLMWIGTQPRVVILDPEIIKDVLSNKFGHFEKPRLNPLAKLLATGLSDYEGEKWAKHRRILNPAFHLEKIKGMVPAFYASCLELISRWDDMMNTQEGSCEVDVWVEFQNLTGDVISRTAFGSNYHEGRPIFKLQSEQAELALKAVFSPYFPGLEYLPTSDNRRRREINKLVTALLKGIIEKKEKAMKLDPEISSQNDLLGLLLESNLKDSQQGGGSKVMTLEDVVEECKLFYFAGQETTSILLNWTMVVLSMHPEWQNRAREEVLKLFGKNKPESDGLTHLKIVAMILYEVLRLYPPVAGLVRATYKEMKLGGITFPPGVELVLPTLYLHNDKELWGEDVEEFNPERFAGGVSKAAKHQNAFFPFGWGPRICIGQNFALTEAKLALSMILQKFWFELSPSYAHAPFNLFTLRPQHGAQIILHNL